MNRRFFFAKLVGAFVAVAIELDSVPAITSKFGLIQWQGKIPAIRRKVFYEMPNSNSPLMSLLNFLDTDTIFEERK